MFLHEYPPLIISYEIIFESQTGLPFWDFFWQKFNSVQRVLMSNRARYQVIVQPTRKG